MRQNNTPLFAENKKHRDCCGLFDYDGVFGTDNTNRCLIAIF